MAPPHQPRIAIIGSGFSGLGLGIHLKRTGLADFSIFEKADRVGGTWRENTYPGAECDVPSALYSFSFERNPRWTHKWSHQPEILAYLEHCARKYGLEPHLRFGSRIVEARFDEQAGDWQVENDRGEIERFDAVVSAVGQLHKPATPEIPGADQFAGPAFHSARWDHSVDLQGRRVAVVGNAASAIQFIPQIAPSASHVTVFQRSANWVVPKNDREYSEREKRLGEWLPLLTKLYRFGLWVRGELMLYPLMSRSARLRSRAEQAARDYLESKIRDPKLREKLVPDYPMGAKRILFSDDYYDALDRDDVDVTTSPIQKIVPEGLVAADGTLHPADVLVYATGFETSSFLAPMRVFGRNGHRLESDWAERGAEAYLGITHTGYPNFFMMYGPNTNLGHNSIVVMIESQIRYMLSCLRHLRASGAHWADVRPEAQREYNRWLESRMSDKVWSEVEKSWYLSAGRVTNNWVGSTQEYWWRTRRFDPEAYEIV